MKCWGTLCTKEPFILRNILLLKNWTHLAKSQFTPQHTLLLNTLCYSKPFTPHCTLLLNTLCHSEPFTPRYTFLLNTLYHSEHFVPQNTILFNTWNNLLLRTLCSSTPFSPWNTLLLNTLWSVEFIWPQRFVSSIGNIEILYSHTHRDVCGLKCYIIIYSRYIPC